jgi:hypothetical protein
MVIALQRRSVRLGDTAALSTRVHSPVCTDVECGRCHAMVRFFCGQNFAYVATLPDPQQPRETPTARALPPLLQALLAVPRASPPRLAREGSIDESDFDLMFSSKADPMIGSFKHFVAMPADAPPMGSPFAPRSYCT